MKGDHESGAVLVLSGMVLLVLISLAALGIDISLAMSERRSAQNAADHAALSASWAACAGDDAQAAAEAAVTRNGRAASELTLTNTGGNTYEAVIDTDSPTFFAKVLGFSEVQVSTRALAECAAGAGSSNAIFALGETCPGFGKEQIDVSGSNQAISGGVHSNGNIDLSGSTNDFDYDVDDSPPGSIADPFTYLHTLTNVGAGNQFETGYPIDLAPGSPPAWPPAPADLLPPPIEYLIEEWDEDDGDFTGVAAAANAAGRYWKVNGDIDGDYILTRGNGVYYATGNIKLDKTITANVTLVAEGFIEFSGSDQVLTPWRGTAGSPIDNALLAFGGEPHGGIDQCDKFVVSMAGSNQSWEGVIYGPNGLVEMNGSSNTTFTGSLIGFSVRLNGSDITIIADPSFAQSSPFVRLAE